MDKNSFILYKDQKPMIDKLTDIQAGQLIKAIYKYVCGDGMPSNLDEVTDMVFTSIQATLHRDLLKYREKCKKSKESVEKRWNKKDTKVNGSIGTNTNEYERIGTNTNYTDSDSVSDSDSDSELYIDDDYIKKATKVGIQRFIEVGLLDKEVANNNLSKFTKKINKASNIEKDNILQLSNDDIFNLYYTYLNIYHLTNEKEDWISCSNKEGYFRKVLKNL